MIRNHALFRDPAAATTGERLLQLGKRARFLIRKGARLGQVSDTLGIGSRTCMLALAFRSAPDVMKFRAMVEEWNALEILAEVRSREPQS